MNQKKNLSEMITQTEPVQQPETKKPKKPRKVRLRETKKRYWVFLDPSVHSTAKKRVKQGYAPDDHLSQLINRLIKNWNDGHYDDAHEKLGWFDNPKT